MPSAKMFSHREREQIKEYRGLDWSIARIAMKLGRSDDGVRKFLKAGDSYGTKKRPGRNPKISAKVKADLIKRALAGTKVKELLRDPLINIGARHIRTIVAAAKKNQATTVENTSESAAEGTENEDEILIDQREREAENNAQISTSDTEYFDDMSQLNPEPEVFESLSLKESLQKDDKTKRKQEKYLYCGDGKYYSCSRRCYVIISTPRVSPASNKQTDEAESSGSDVMKTKKSMKRQEIIRKLNNLDVSSDEEHVSDEDFKGTSPTSDSEVDEEDLSMSSVSESSLDLPSEKSKSHTSTMLRGKRVNRIVSDSDSDDEPLIKTKLARKKFCSAEKVLNANVDDEEGSFTEYSNGFQNINEDSMNRSFYEDRDDCDIMAPTSGRANDVLNTVQLVRTSTNKLPKDAVMNNSEGSILEFNKEMNSLVAAPPQLDTSDHLKGNGATEIKEAADKYSGQGLSPILPEVSTVTTKFVEETFEVKREHEGVPDIFSAAQEPHDDIKIEEYEVVEVAVAVEEQPTFSPEPEQVIVKLEQEVKEDLILYDVAVGASGLMQRLFEQISNALPEAPFLCKSFTIILDRCNPEILQ